MDPKNYGLDEEALATIETEGAKLTPEAKKRGPRATTLKAAQDALKEEKAIPFLFLGSAANPHVNDKAWALWKLYAGVDYDGLSAYGITGTNTYAKMLRGYKDLLLASTAEGVEPDGAMIADATAAWDAHVAQREAERIAARAAKRALKDAAKAEAEPRPFKDTPSEELTAKADALDADISAKRKTETRETLDEWRAQSKAMRRELTLRTTPEQKAVNAVAHKGPDAVKAAAEAVKAHPKPNPKPGDEKLIKRTGPAKAPKKATQPAEKPKPAPKIEVYTSQKAAITAARKELGSDAVEGVDFRVTGKGKRLSWIAIGANAS